MASLLLGRRPPEAPVADLVRWCGVFGIAEGTARVALHRMAAKQEVEVRDGVYRLAGRLARRQARQERSLAPRVRSWRGEWRVALVAANRRDASTRAGLRASMRRLHFAERREGVWMRPDNLDVDIAAAVRDQMEWLRARPDADPVALAARLFHPERWARRAEALTAGLEALTESLAPGEDESIADAFVAGAAALQHIGLDPLLPAELLPADWPGATLRTEYARYQRAFDRVARAWFRAHSALTSLS
jgi:phenylacetic acid degradation operon negative regulatory protein